MLGLGVIRCTHALLLFLLFLQILLSCNWMADSFVETSISSIAVVDDVDDVDDVDEDIIQIDNSIPILFT
jgi:hypothetical protein